MDPALIVPADSVQACKDAVAYIRERLPPRFMPKIGVICGSNTPLTASDLGKDCVEICLEDIPGFVKSTVVTTQAKRKLLAGSLGDTPVVVVLGRIQYYEGYSLKQITLPIRVLKKLGVDTLIVTGAVSSIDHDIKIGDIAVIADHVSLPAVTGLNPLIGPHLSQMGPRYPSMANTYTYKLRKLTFKTWLQSPSLKARGIRLAEAIYGYSTGPSFETRAEIRALKLLGCNIVGNCITPEIMMARYCGMDVLALCMVTTMAPYHREPSALDAAVAELEGRKLPITKEEEEEDILAYKDNIRQSMKRSMDVKLLINEILEHL
ncbi:Purine nucleoside phosphorylase [Spiromyces aspiralis]|uniref:Purine nucleoside phosphorylase n=1 Tax=Spiromyces aspiralis TaxID=68401 RepID=A0ACC1HDT4_9FUNG|nr:Purine nucleoside phosphorylase [Spiromyces aspiralis]